MSWRDNLRQASFRGVPFKVLSHTYSVGRRNTVHQYPNQDVPYAEDLGLDADEFTIEGYIIQTAQDNDDYRANYDYFTERDALITALKASGKGTLIHPFLGEKVVVTVGRQSIRETFDSGGWARFSMQFMLAGENITPAKVINPVGSVDDAAENVLNTSADNFYNQYDITDKPGWVVDSVTNDFSSFINSMKSTVTRIRATSGSSLEQIKMVFDDTRTTMLEVAAYPCQVAGLVNDVFESVLGLANLVGSGYLGEVLGNCSGQVYFNKLDPNGSEISRDLGYSMANSLLFVSGDSDYNGYGVTSSNSLSSIGGDLDEITVSTETRARQAANRLAMINIIRAQALMAAMRAAIRINYDSVQQLKAMQDKIILSLDYLLLKLGDESSSDPYNNYGIYVDHRDLYGAIEDLRSVFIRAMREKILSVAIELVIEAPPDSISALQLAHQRYNDLSREDEIYQANKTTIKHPGFMTGELRVLSE